MRQQDSEDHVLTIWQAITLLGEADDACDATERGSRQTVISSNRRSVSEVTCWFDDLADDY